MGCLPKKTARDAASAYVHCLGGTPDTCNVTLVIGGRAQRCGRRKKSGVLLAVRDCLIGLQTPQR